MTAQDNSPDNDRGVISPHSDDMRGIGGEFDIHHMRGMTRTDLLRSILHNTGIVEETHIAEIITWRGKREEVKMKKKMKER
jgi:hypothetical protein